MNERNATNISSELCRIEENIKYFEELKYHEGVNVYEGNHLYLSCGLSEEDFNKIKNKIVEMLKDCYNKKSDELIEFCKVNKK